MRNKAVFYPYTSFIKSTRALIRFYAIVAIAALIGCASVGPDYVPPDTAVSDAWHTELGSGLIRGETDPVKLAKWWTMLDDPELNRLIERAAAGNLDVKQAEARLREARGQRSIVEADLFPTLDATGTATRSHSSKNMGSGTARTLYSTSFDAGWEIDVFGGVRRSVEAADANLMARQEDLRDVMVSLMAEVALNYIEIRTYQARLTTAEANIRNLEETCQLTQWRYQAGLTDELDVQRALSSLESIRARVPTLRISLEAAKNRVAVLIGTQPGELHGELEAARPVPVVPLAVAVGVPADVLRQRPDVRVAERELAAQTVRVGVATADLYPKFTLNGFIGFDALSTGSLWTEGSRSDSFGPRITWRIFNAGAIRQNIEVQSAKQEQALAGYEATVLSALEETENALVSYVEEHHRRDGLILAVRAAQQAFDLAQYKYQAGVIDFTSLLDAQRSLISLQDDAVISDGGVTSSMVRLYKALGGGWAVRTGESEKKYGSKDNT
ncbi:MAG: efflux transporter outer membrane subunit [Pseudomonadota bacterium]